MRYVPMQTGEEGREYPRRVFERGENITISSGYEAALRIPGLKSRFYIRGMKVFSEINSEEGIYRNWQKIKTGEFPLYPGDVFFLGNLKLEVWEAKISIQGPADSYKTEFIEASKGGRPEGIC